MLKTRVIPCLLWDANDNCVKGQSFGADPRVVASIQSQVELYISRGVDELILLDIDATKVGYAPRWGHFAHMLDQADMPVTYGGGIKTVAQAQMLLKHGADKIAIRSSAENYDFIKSLVNKFGSQAIVAVIDVREEIPGLWKLRHFPCDTISLMTVANIFGVTRRTCVYWEINVADFPKVTHERQNTRATVVTKDLIRFVERNRHLKVMRPCPAAFKQGSEGLEPFEYVLTHALKCEEAGAGEILLTSMDREGTFQGYDLDLIGSVCQAVKIPVIAHGGAGQPMHCLDAIRAGAHAVAAGAMFHFTEVTPKGVARWLQAEGVPTRVEAA